MKKIFLLMCILFVMVLTGCQEDVCAEKPVIYLYPEQETKVKVQLDYDGTLVCTYICFGKEIRTQPMISAKALL